MPSSPPPSGRLCDAFMIIGLLILVGLLANAIYTAVQVMDCVDRGCCADDKSVAATERLHLFACALNKASHHYFILVPITLPQYNGTCMHAGQRRLLVANGCVFRIVCAQSCHL